MMKLRDDLPSNRFRGVGYGFEIPDAGTFLGYPHGVVPWDGDFGTICHNQPDSRGLDKTDFLSLYEVAMSQWLGETFKVGNVTLPVVFAAPKQAFSSYWYALPNNVKASYLQSCGGGGPDDVPATQPPPPNMAFSRYPLPFISFFRNGVKQGVGQNSVPLRHLGFLDRERTKTGWSKFPTPYELTFQVSVWSKYRAMHNWFFSVFDSAFNQGMSWLTVPPQLSDDGEPFLGAIMMSSIDDSTEEATEDTETVFRWTFGLTVEARRFYEVRAAPVAQEIVIGVREYTEPGSTQLAP